MANESEISIHDNHLLGYSVDSTSKEIVLKTAYSDAGGEERTDVVFHDVAAYHFEFDPFGTVLYEIAETDPAEILKENWALFQRGFTQAGWPGGWASSHQKAADFFKSNSIRGFIIASSIGLQGWVLARSMEIVPRDS